MKINEKEYIGEGVYAVFNGYAVILTTENGIEATNTIEIDEHVYRALIRWVGGMDQHGFYFPEKK